MAQGLKIYHNGPSLETCQATTDTEELATERYQDAIAEWKLKCHKPPGFPR